MDDSIAMENFIPFEQVKIIKKVGEGALSEVYKVEIGTDTYALKKLRSHFNLDPKTSERFSLEGTTLAKMDDSRIVKFHGNTQDDDGRLGLICEFIDGKTIDAIASPSVNDRPIIASIIVSEILLALEQTHRQQIIHRDIKPQNVLITQAGKIKLTDFGLAKNFENQTLTHTGLILGSPAYMSPEHLTQENICEGSDLFSLGILLYYLCAGELPFQAGNFPQLSHCILNATPKDITRINPYVHPHLVHIINKSLQKDLKKRYLKAYEFRHDLMQFLDKFELPPFTQILKDFYAERAANLVEQTSMVEELINLIKNAESRAAKMQLAKHGLLIDSSEKFFEKTILGSRSQAIRNKIYLLTGCLAIFTIIFYVSNNISYEKSLPLTNNIPSHDTKIIPTPTPKVIASRPRTMAKPTPKTGIWLNVDDDVSVLINERNVIIPANKILYYPAGTHKLTLTKKGFRPIENQIVLESGKITTINARSNH